MIVQGRLLIDPLHPPELGWISINQPVGDTPASIDSIAFGELPSDVGPPDIGGRDRLICPAFADAHFHVPQVDSVGCDGMPLLEWLDTVIFPAETWWARGGAIPDTRTAARRLISQGTALVAAYLTAHAEAAREAATFLATRTPLRFIAGRVAMDRCAPEGLTGEDIARAKLAPPPSPIMPAVSRSPRHRISANPRFAISCTPELMAEVGWAVKDRPEVIVQTHLAETLPECARVRELFPHLPHYTAVYDEAGLLRRGTLLAHAIHLADEELDIIRERGSIAVHCPTANTFLQAGLFDLARTNEDFGVQVALGTDVAAGPDVAMPRVARGMIEVAKMLKMTRSGSAANRVKIPSPAEAWDMITRRNADLLGAPRCCRLEVGAEADVLVLRAPDSWFDEHVVGRLIYNWSADLIESRVMNGQVINPSSI
ncbi:MAG: amidohydrolase family protein [Phycisphaerales bacterium]|nr:amidohydrolase family protein [Phycisphaerales bacterium]